MSVELPGRKVSGTFGVSAVAMRNQRNDIAVATRTSCNNRREARYREWACACRRGTEVPGLMSREVLQDRNIQRSGQIRSHLAPACQLDACFQRARSITVPQFAQVRRSELA